MKKRRWMQIVLWVVPIAVVGFVLSMFLMKVLAKPGPLGVVEGRLQPCPDRPNCVCSCEEGGSKLEPFPFQGTAVQSWARLSKVLEGWPRTTVVERTETYIHAECRSLVFRFVDDVEFLLDEEKGVIHCRSASRAGHSDLGVNRARIEEMRRAYLGETSPDG